MEINKILQWIDEDIEYQEAQLKDDFHRDMSINWRVVGMKSLKRKIEIELKDVKSTKSAPKTIGNVDWSKVDSLYLTCNVCKQPNVKVKGEGLYCDKCGCDLLEINLSQDNQNNSPQTNSTGKSNLCVNTGDVEDTKGETKGCGRRIFPEDNPDNIKCGTIWSDRVHLCEDCLREASLCECGCVNNATAHRYCATGCTKFQKDRQHAPGGKE